PTFDLLFSIINRIQHYNRYTNNYYLCIKRFVQGTLYLKDPIFKVCRFHFPRNYYPEVYFIYSLNLKY
ncbi:hypothetical protein NEUTE1DRAFT_46886, partial [Neurospora tetrasperma FGSC 2508]